MKHESDVRPEVVIMCFRAFFLATLRDEMAPHKKANFVASFRLPMKEGILDRNCPPASRPGLS
jgi:hypothetical protein